MLKKLLKYELKSTSRIMWILYAAAIACGALLGVIVNLQLRSSGNDSLDLAFSGEGRLQVLSILLIAFIAVYVLLLTAIMVTTFILIIMRFYRNLLLGEGYLMHTLPVEPASLITSKLLVAILWILIAGVASILSAAVLGLTSGVLPRALAEVPFRELVRGLLELVNGKVVLFLAGCFLGMVAQILQYYFAMAIGNLANQHKLLFSALAYIGLSSIMSFVTVVLMITGNSFFVRDGLFESTLIRAIILSVISGVIYFLGTNYILKNKLNLA